MIYHVIIDGTIGVGKTTVMKRFAEKFKCIVYGERVPRFTLGRFSQEMREILASGSLGKQQIESALRSQINILSNSVVDHQDIMDGEEGLYLQERFHKSHKLFAQTQKEMGFLAEEDYLSK